MKGRSLHVIKLPENSQGKELLLRTQKREGYKEEEKNLGKSYLGEEHDVFIRLFCDNAYAFFFGFFALLTSVLTLCLLFYFKDKLFDNLFKAIINLCIAIFITGIWVVTDSELLVFFTDKVTAVAFISYTSFMIMPVFLLQFIDNMLGKSKKIKLLCELFLVVGLLYFVDYLLELVPSYVLLFPIHFLCICSIIVVLKDLYRIWKDGEKRDAVKGLLYGFVGLAVFVMWALIIFCINPVSPYSYLYCIGMVVFIICLIVSAIGKLYEQVEESANIAAYKRLAYTDTMTGLGNRTAFNEEQETTELFPGKTYILFDINNLKFINDRYGHQAGDTAIIAAAGYIREEFGDKGKCYRIGGDEFVAIIKECTENVVKESLCRLQDRVEQDNRDRKIPISIAAGYAILISEGETADHLYKRADASMYAEKQRMKRELHI